MIDLEPSDRSKASRRLPPHSTHVKDCAAGVDAVIAALAPMATTSSEDASVLVDGLAFDAMIQAETDLLRGMHRVGIGTLRLATATNDTTITTSEARVEVGLTSVQGQTQGKDVSQVKVLAAALNVEPFKTKLIDVVAE
jgi:hypothetical protein